MVFKFFFLNSKKKNPTNLEQPSIEKDPFCLQSMWLQHGLCANQQNLLNSYLILTLFYSSQVHTG